DPSAASHRVPAARLRADGQANGAGVYLTAWAWATPASGPAGAGTPRGALLEVNLTPFSARPSSASWDAAPARPGSDGRRSQAARRKVYSDPGFNPSPRRVPPGSACWRRIPVVARDAYPCDIASQPPTEHRMPLKHAAAVPFVFAALCTALPASASEAAPKRPSVQTLERIIASRTPQTRVDAPDHERITARRIDIVDED